MTTDGIDESPPPGRGRSTEPGGAVSPAVPAVLFAVALVAVLILAVL